MTMTLPATDGTKNSMDEVRIVVVDDFPDAAALLASGLQLDGYRVRVAHDGAQALAVIEEFEPHCVLLDVNMPGLDGAELSKRLRARFGDDIVLIAVTGGGPDDPRVAETFDRVDHYLTKPVNPAVLRKILPPL